MKTILSFSIFSILLFINLTLHTMENHYQAITFTTQKDNDKVITQKNLLKKNRKKYNSVLDILNENAKKIARPNEICIPMYNSRFIQWFPSKSPSQIISINRLAGCSATILHSMYKNGERNVGITLYPKNCYDKQQQKVKKVCLETLKKHFTNNIFNIYFYFVAPKNNTQIAVSSHNNSEHKELNYKEKYISLKNIVETTLTMPIIDKVPITFYYISYEMGNPPSYSVEDIRYQNKLPKNRDVEISLLEEGTAIFVYAPYTLNEKI